ncbi:MAG: hypothetical protein AB1861_12530, partial [Cyanobacteriota bacterium]
STNLRNKQYYIFNQPYTKEEYQDKLAEMNLGNRDTIDMLRDRMKELYLKSVHRYANIYRSVDVLGDNIEDSKNCRYCFDLAGNAEDCKYCNWGTFGLKDSYDTGPGTGGRSEMTYEGVSIGVNNANCAFGTIVWYSNDLRYGFNCHNCQHVFGCVSLRDKQYCILNKQYSKEEYQKILPRVIEHMNSMPYRDKQGIEYRFGEHFPIEISPFAYNDTIAQEYFPISESEALRRGYSWSQKEDGGYIISISGKDLPGDVSLVKDDILEKVIGCAHEEKCSHQCPGAYRITPPELDFYRKFGIPLPKLCFNCRHYARLEQRNPMKLWQRKCMCNGLDSSSLAAKHGHLGACENVFQTPFSEDRAEIVYCEDCYNKEVV